MSTATRSRKAADAPAASPNGEPAPFILTASLADLARQKREAVQRFDLSATAPGAYAMVRLVDLGDVATLTDMPDHLLTKVLMIANDVEIREGRTKPVNDDGTFNAEHVLKLMRANKASVNAYCVSGFVDPPVIFEETDRTNPEQLVVDMIHPADRQRFFDWCHGRHAEAAATVAPFPEPRELADGVAAGGPGGVQRKAAKRPANARADGGDD